MIMEKLGKCEANYTALTPINFLIRAAKSYADRTSVVYGAARFSWQQTYHRCCRLASSLRQLGIAKNDVVSVLAPNIPALYEMHFAVPMAGAILNPINTRLDANNVMTILAHSEAKLLMVDYEYIPLACNAFHLLKTHHSSLPLPLVVIINDIGHNYKQGDLKFDQLVLSTTNRDSITESSFPLLDVDSPTKINGRHKLEYEELVSNGDPNFVVPEVEDEWDTITLNYTSGTTSAPKGVAYSHRGAYLSTLSLILGWEMGSEPVYLWTLPMFHCNGWTFTWGVAARGGTNICIRSPSGPEIYKSIVLHGVTHMCCAPVVFSNILSVPPNERTQIRPQVRILTGGAPPAAAVLQKMEQLGFHIDHAYGLTEATGPALVCEWQKEWNNYPKATQGQLKARQGISVLTVADANVIDLGTKQSVARDGKTMGEIVLKGSGIMKGYLKDEKATSDAFACGWFHSGDLGVIHPDGYIEIKDRKKDVIISGGENISSVEVENKIMEHPKVLEAAVVAMPHPKWGESPCAFVVLRNEGINKNEVVKEQDILLFCRNNLSHYMVPKKVVFVEHILRNPTGKIKKDVLRDIAKKFDVPNNDNEVVQTSHTMVMSRL